MASYSKVLDAVRLTISNVVGETPTGMAISNRFTLSTNKNIPVEALYKGGKAISSLREGTFENVKVIEYYNIHEGW